MAKEVNTTQDVGVGECGWWVVAVGGWCGQKEIEPKRDTVQNSDAH